MPSDQSKTTRSLVFWGIALILAYAPYQRGLFFEREWLYTFILTAILLGVALLTRRKYLSTIYYTKIDFAVMAFVLTYLISALTAVNAGAAVVEALKLLDLLATYWLVAHGGWGKRDTRALLQIVFWFGLGVALLGIGAALGLVQVNGGYIDGRIYSTLQYPNTLATYLGVVFLLGVYLWQTTRTLLRYIYPAALCLVVTCLVGTGSRGGMGFFILALPVIVWLQPVTIRRQFAAKVFLSLCMGGLVAWGFLQYLTANPTGSGVILLLGTILSGCLSLVIDRFGQIPLRRLVVVLVLVIVGSGVILTVRSTGNSPLHRLETASLQLHSFQERLTYYKDGLKIIQDRPLQGYGGGGWAMYPRYQSYPYQVSDPHNQLVKVGVESGTLGLLTYLVWWLLLVQLAWRQTKSGDTRASIMLGCLLLIGTHSLMDFDLSFGAMQLLLWTFSGILVVSEPSSKSQQAKPVLKYVTVGTMVGVALLLAGSGISLLQASEQQGWSTLYIEQGNPVAAIQHLRLARQRDPFSSGYPAALADLYYNSRQVQDLAKAQAAVDTALRLNSTDTTVKNLASRILLARGQLDQAAALAEDQLSFTALQESAYLRLAQFYKLLADKAQEQGHLTQARNFLQQGALLVERFQARLDQVPLREAGLWVGGKPKVSSQLQQVCAELRSEAANIH